jgi:hypothetical protein
MSDSIVNFLVSRPLISVRGLEKLCNIPDSTIRQAIAGKKKIPDKHLRLIQKEIIMYGYLP